MVDPIIKSLQTFVLTQVELRVILISHFHSRLIARGKRRFLLRPSSWSVLLSVVVPSIGVGCPGEGLLMCGHESLFGLILDIIEDFIADQVGRVEICVPPTLGVRRLM
jgi:hypothetical protein